MRSPLALLSLLAVTAACGQPIEDELGSPAAQLTAEAKGATTRAPAYALDVGSAQDGKWATSFPISSTRNLYFALDAQGLPNGHHTVAFEVRMPDGSAFARYDVAVAVGVAAGPGEQQAQVVKGGVRVWLSMPVAGTIIDQYTIAGSWAANAGVDGSPAVAFTVFQLN